MASSSPYSPNEYSAVSNYRPMELPINEIAKASIALDQFWTAGAARVKSAYDSALGLDLTSEENINVRNEFMKDVEKQINKLSTMDLSSPSVQRQGLSLFKPLFQDKDIMMDNQLTKQQQQIISDAKRYRDDVKTKGAGYHPDNLNYALMPFEGFNSRTKRGEIQGVFDKARNSVYTPFYDDTEERNNIISNCKSNKISGDTITGMYNVTETDLSLTKQKLWSCLQAGLSENARMQTRITAAVRYRNDYETLRQDYINGANSQIEYYKEEIADLETSKAANKDDIEYVKRVDDLIKEYKKQIKDQELSLNGDPTGQDKTKIGIRNWTPDYIKSNYEDLAYNSYFQRKYGAVAEGFSYTDVGTEKKSDPVSLGVYIQDRLDARQDKLFKQQLLLKSMTNDDGTPADPVSAIEKLRRVGAQSGLSSTEVENMIQSYYTQAEEDQGYNLSSLNAKIADYGIQIKQYEEGLARAIQGDKYLKNILPDLEIPKDTQGYLRLFQRLQSYIVDKKSKNISDPEAEDWRNQLQQYIVLTNQRLGWESIKADAISQVEKNNPNIATNYKTGIQKIKKDLDVVILPTGQILDPDRIVNIFSGNDPIFGVETYQPPKNAVLLQSISLPTYIYRKDDPSKQMLKVLDGGLMNAYSAHKALSLNKESNLNSKIDEYLNQHDAVQKLVISAGNLLGSGKLNEPKPTRTLEFLKNAFGNALPGGLDVTLNTVGDVDAKEGWITVQATGNKKGERISANDMIDAIVKENRLPQNLIDTTYKNDNAIRIKIPWIAGTLTEPTYGDLVRNQVNYMRSRVDEEKVGYPTGGVSMDAGLTPQGNKVAIKVVRKPNGQAGIYVTLNGETQYTGYSSSASDVEYVVQEVDRLLNGELSKNIKD